VVKPTEQEAEQLMAEQQAQGQQQDPNAIFLQAAAEEAVAKAAKARADTVETIASAELKRAQTIETLEKTQREGDMAELDAVKVVKEIWRG